MIQRGLDALFVNILLQIRMIRRTILLGTKFLGTERLSIKSGPIANTRAQRTIEAV
jgi:hypothetical protein